MKKMILLNCVLMMFIVVSGQSKNDKAVADAVDRLRLAMISADKTELEKLTSDELSYGHSGGTHEWNVSTSASIQEVFGPIWAF